jgi:hypothetical protein
MREVYNVSVVSHVIQLATAPVFLLAAVSTLLTVMTNRLGRIIDRSRQSGETIMRQKDNRCIR